MFVGYLHCDSCRYKTRHFMASHHPFRPHDVLFQHEGNRRIRIKQFPDDDAFYAKDQTAIDRYFAALQQKHAKPKERIIRLSGWEDEATPVLCRRCNKSLFWKTTGIA